MKNKYLSLVILLLITFIAPVIGSYITATFKEPWYSEIILPSFNPPSWVFAPVWSTFYLLMTVAVWKIWKTSFDTRILKIYFIH
jgi:tryptophan-rich sensory protein